MSMKRLLTIGLLSIALPVFASDPGDPDPAFEPQAWTGKHSDQLIASWGKPRKTKRDGKDGKVLVYRLRFFAIDLVGETIVVWSDAGIEPTDVEVPNTPSPDISYTGGPRVIATQKVKFYVDAEGIVQGQESAPRKWKRKP